MGQGLDMGFSELRLKAGGVSDLQDFIINHLQKLREKKVNGGGGGGGIDRRVNVLGCYLVNTYNDTASW